MPSSLLQSIHHIVVLMLENRSEESQCQEAVAFAANTRRTGFATARTRQPGGLHHTMPPLKTNRDDRNYVRKRTDAWKASGKVSAASVQPSQAGMKPTKGGKGSRRWLVESRIVDTRVKCKPRRQYPTRHLIPFPRIV
jgi:hypothetical protein